MCAGMALMVVVVVAVGGGCPYLPTTECPTYLRTCGLLCGKISLPTATSTLTGMGRSCGKMDEKKKMGRTKEIGAILFVYLL